LVAEPFLDGRGRTQADEIEVPQLRSLDEIWNCAPQLTLPLDAQVEQLRRSTPCFDVAVCARLSAHDLMYLAAEQPRQDDGR
jgi:hypothetical protein